MGSVLEPDIAAELIQLAASLYDAAALSGANHSDLTAKSKAYTLYSALVNEIRGLTEASAA